MPADIMGAHRAPTWDGTHLLAFTFSFMLGMSLFWQAWQPQGASDRPPALHGVSEGAIRRQAMEALAVGGTDHYAGTASVEVPEPAMGTDEPRADAEEISTEIVFDINSSALPPAGRDRLRRVVAMLERTGGRVVELAAAVNEDGVRGAGPIEARRYNRWLGHRRMERIGEWLRREVQSPLTIVPTFLERDPTRRVVVKVRQRS